MRKHKDLGTIGVVLGGGGGKSLFHVGVLSMLHHHNIPLSYLGAVSGASIAAAAFLEKQPHMEEFERTAMIKFRNPPFCLNRELLRHPWKGKSLLNNEPLRQLVMELDMNKVLSSPIELRVIAANASTGQARLFSNRDSSGGVLVKAIVASTAIPIFFKPEEINGELFIDGGTLFPHPIPILMKDAKAWGCDTVIVVETDPHNYHVRADVIRQWGWFQHLMHRFALTDQWPNEGVKMHWRPRVPLLSSSSLRWEPKDPERMIMEGKMVTETQLKRANLI